MVLYMPITHFSAYPSFALNLTSTDFMLASVFTLLALLSNWFHPALLQVKKRLRVSEERKQAELALRQSEERLRLALEAGQLGIWDWNVLTDEVTWSDDAEQLFGLAPGTFGGTCEAFLNCIHPEDRESTFQAMDHAFEAKTGYELEFRIVWPEGSIHWMTAKSQLFCDETGRAVRVVGTNLDITKRKQAELALRQQNERERLLRLTAQRIRQSLNLEDILNTTVAEVRQVLQADRVLIYRFEPDGNGVVEVESVAPDCLSALNTTYTPCGDWLHRYQQGHIQVTEDVHSVDPSQLMLAQCQTKAGLVAPILQGELWGLLVAHQCSTSRQWQQAEIDLLSSLATQVAIAIRQAQLYQATLAQVETLEKLNQLKDDFISTVSHELRTPISNMKMSIRMLEISLGQQAGIEMSKAARYLQILRDECEREIRLINDLLDWQQLEAGVLPKELEIIEIQTWIPQIVEPFRERTEQQQQLLQIDLDPELPPLLSDNASLERILTELLNNACKYTPPGEKITLTAEAVKTLPVKTLPTKSLGRAQFRVSNSGVEIPANELPRIFDKFYRIRRDDRWQRGGTGLGLALVRRLTEHLGGTLVAESVFNQTTFTVELPLLSSSDMTLLHE